MQTSNSFTNDVLDTIAMLSAPFCFCAGGGAVQLAYGLFDGSRNGIATLVAIGIALTSSLVVSITSTVHGIQKRRHRKKLTTHGSSPQGNSTSSGPL